MLMPLGLAAACHAQGALLLLDASQCCGAIPIDVNQLGVDFMVPLDTMAARPLRHWIFLGQARALSKMRPGPFYWMAAKARRISPRSIR